MFVDALLLVLLFMCALVWLLSVGYVAAIL